MPLKLLTNLVQKYVNTSVIANAAAAAAAGEIMGLLN